jgi:hypothetical protein
MAKKIKIKTEDLVGKGYFPEELPPVFSSYDLGNLVPKILSHLHSHIHDHKVGKLLSYSIPKARGYRRNLSIPNPLHYIQLAKTISDHWADIIAHCDKSKISLSRLHLGGNRAISRFQFDEFIDTRLLKSVGNRFLLKIDITRFYNSIYTHSIPWALHTKAAAKLDYKRLPHFGNGLDIDSRNLQDMQTIGLPIGPDTSRIISEIILCAIDVHLQQVLPGLQGVRIIDDYYLYFRNISEVETARSAVHMALKAYELELNPSKESIIELPEILENNWYRELKEIRFSNDALAQRKQLISFFDKAFYYSKTHSEEAVLSYALSKIRPTVFYQENTKILVALLLNALILEPKTISMTCEILSSFSLKGYPMDKSLLFAALNEFIVFHAQHDHEFEVSWGLWTLKNLAIDLSPVAAAELSVKTNSIIVLLALDLKRSKRIPSGLDTSLWRTMLTTDNLYGENWLLAYELKVRGWLRTADDYLSADPFFKKLKDNKVRFYNPEQKVDISKVKASASTPSMAEYIDEENDLPIKQYPKVLTVDQLPPKPKKLDLEALERLRIKFSKKDARNEDPV